MLPWSIPDISDGMSMRPTLNDPCRPRSTPCASGCSASPTPTLLVCYEAGPTGFEMAQLLQDLGVACQVIAPGLVPKRATDRVKTDRRDAVRLAEFSRAGTLTPVRVPTRVEEAFRDLVRTRTMAVEDQARVRHRVKSALLRWGVAVPGARRDWTAAYVAWIRQWSPDEGPRAQA